MKYLFLLLGLILLPLFSSAQIIDNLEDEEKFYAETKQVNQFFRRFNGEEDEQGNRYYENDKDYRSNSLRKNYLRNLFDFQNTGLDRTLAKDFINTVNDKQNPQFIDFHAPGWFAQVNAEFQYEGSSKQVIMFLQLEQEKLGYKWVIGKVYFEPFLNNFMSDTAYTKKFLHPMSHELDFMNLRKAFADQDSVEQYIAKEFKPDYLTLFLYEIKRRKLVFQYVKSVKFHFFQIENWYFELSYFNREGMNTGWLISNLVQYKPEDKTILTDYIFYEN
jgi:hypothetical protein